MHRSRFPRIRLGDGPTPLAPMENLSGAPASPVEKVVGAEGVIARERTMANCDYVGAGDGLPTPDMIEALKMFAGTVGILLDPVYSGKRGEGLIDLVKMSFCKRGENVVFLHTGGVVSLFGYEHALAPAP